MYSTKLLISKLKLLPLQKGCLFIDLIEFFLVGAENMIVFAFCTTTENKFLIVKISHNFKTDFKAHVFRIQIYNYENHLLLKNKFRRSSKAGFLFKL